MTKFIPYEKLSKKEKRKLDLKIRGDWGTLKPTSRVCKSKKLYTRKLKHKKSIY